MVPTILLGFPNAIFVQTISLPDPIPYMPALLVSCRAVPILSVLTTWPEGVRYTARVGISNISVGGKYSVLEVGSFRCCYPPMMGRNWGLPVHIVFLVALLALPWYHRARVKSVFPVLQSVRPRGRTGRTTVHSPSF